MNLKAGCAVRVIGRVPPNELKAKRPALTRRGLVAKSFGELRMKIMDTSTLIAFIIVYAVGAAMGIFLEHFLGPKPKLSNDELMDAADRIVGVFGRDYNKCRAVMGELQVWMEADDLEMGHLSSELHAIIEGVRNSYHGKN